MKEKENTEKEKLISKKISKFTFLCCHKKKADDDDLHREYLLDVTIYNGRYLTTYKDWLDRNKIN